MRLEIPFKTPTINHLYGQHGFRRFLKKEAKGLKQEIVKLVVAANAYIPPKPLRIKVEIYENWYCLNGNIAKKDISNREKFLIDSVFEALEIDDKFIFEHNLIKKQSLFEEKAIIEIETL